MAMHRKHQRGGENNGDAHAGGKQRRQDATGQGHRSETAGTGQRESRSIGHMRLFAREEAQAA